MNQPVPLLPSQDEDHISDTVIFDKETSNSNNGTPPNKTMIGKVSKFKKSTEEPKDHGAPHKEKRLTRESIIVPGTVKDIG